jgi:hypothetical protein
VGVVVVVVVVVVVPFAAAGVLITCQVPPKASDPFARRHVLLIAAGEPV